MIQKVDVPVTALGVFDHQKRSLVFEKVLWEGRSYEIKKLGYHHNFRRGRTLYHVFSLVSENLFFRLVLDTESLTMRVMEIADENAD